MLLIIFYFITFSSQLSFNLQRRANQPNITSQILSLNNYESSGCQTLKNIIEGQIIYYPCYPTNLNYNIKINDS